MTESSGLQRSQWMGDFVVMVEESVFADPIERWQDFKTFT